MPDTPLPEATLQAALYQALDMMNARRVRKFSVPPATLIGPGAIGNTGLVLAERGLRSVFVMVDGALIAAGITSALERSLKQYGVTFDLSACPPGEPVDTDVRRMVEEFRRGRYDAILGMGGGSVLDAAKAVAVLAANPDISLAALVPGASLAPRLPFVAIPTTSGTGSEATNVSVVIEAGQHIKRVMVHSSLLPDVAIIDACLTLGVPAPVTAATGIDALTHAVEAYVSAAGSPLTEAMALRAITMIGTALPVAVGQGHDIEAREQMMLASYMAGMAFSNAGLGLCHACAHQIGAAYRLPHGLANAILLPQIMRFNRLVCKRAFADIGSALTGRPVDDLEAIAAVEDLIRDVGLFRRLGAFGGREEDFPGFADAALEDITIKTNPRTVTKDEIISIYRSIQ
ncbi:MAG: iron-containing alcohol dehydrogenase [Telmatospirillum sp.]|nr:iron-containing alcohol dehydrogenase [Telmatospirillum sp.]